MALIDPQRIHERTPASRNRYADMLRVTAILGVVFGHWMVRVVIVDDGELTHDYLLAVVPKTQWFTWLFQVMPVFFFVGGYANLRGWRSAAERGEDAVTWVRIRARRLFRPLVPLLCVWIPLSAVLEQLGVSDDVLVFGAEDAIVPAWFLAAYLLVTAMTPITSRWHERWGAKPVLVLTVAAVAVDALRFTLPGPLADTPLVDGQPAFAAINYLFVWLAIHQFGYLWLDERLPRHPSSAAVLCAAGYGILLIMVLALPYSVSMVGVPGADSNNHQPPTVALVALGAGQVGLALLLRPVLEPFLHRPRWWAPVVMVGSQIMTIFLWHQTAMMAVSTAVYPTGLWPVISGVDATWWATRPVWLLLLTIALVILVMAFGRFETAPPGQASHLPEPAARIKAAAGVILTVAGLGLLIVGGLTDPEGWFHLPVLPLGALVAGLLALGVIGSRWAARLTERVHERLEIGSRGQ